MRKCNNLSVCFKISSLRDVEACFACEVLVVVMNFWYWVSGKSLWCLRSLYLLNHYAYWKEQNTNIQVHSQIFCQRICTFAFSGHDICLTESLLQSLHVSASLKLLFQQLQWSVFLSSSKLALHDTFVITPQNTVKEHQIWWSQRPCD